MFKGILNYLFITKKVEPVNSLHKQEEAEDILQKLNDIIARNFYIIALVVMVLAIFLLAWVCFTVAGTAMESGNYYYHLQEAI